MAQDLTVNIKTTSDVPQAMDRAKSATVSFGKQVEDITKKFSTGFKDIFLSFLGPMALLGTAIAYIGKLIADNQRAHAEANQAAIDQTNKLMSAEDTYWARKQAREKKTKDDIDQAKMSREDTTLQFLREDPRGQQIYGRENVKYLRGARGDGALSLNYSRIKQNKAIQDEVQALIAEDLAKTGMIAKPGEAGQKPTTFQSPAGVNAVVGMGNNAAVQAQLDQLDESRKQTMLLEQIASAGGNLPSDFTKGSGTSTAAPSRSYLLTK